MFAVPYVHDVIRSSQTTANQFPELAVDISTTGSHFNTTNIIQLETEKEFPAQIASNAENVSIWWRHYESAYFMCGSACAFFFTVIITVNLSDNTWKNLP